MFYLGGFCFAECFLRYAWLCDGLSALFSLAIFSLFNVQLGPISAVAEGVRCMKNVVSTLLSGEDVAEANFYFDYTINAMQ